MKRTVAKIIHKGTYRVVFDDADHFRPYSVLKETYGGGTKHINKLVSYSDFASCLHYITEELVNP